MSKWAWLGNAIVAVALIVAYTVLSATGHDGTAVLGLLGGQGISAGLAQGTAAAGV